MDVRDQLATVRRWIPKGGLASIALAAVEKHVARLEHIEDAARCLVDAEDAQDEPQTVWTAGEKLRAALSAGEEGEAE